VRVAFGRIGRRRERVGVVRRTRGRRRSDMGRNMVMRSIYEMTGSQSREMNGVETGERGLDTISLLSLFHSSRVLIAHVQLLSKVRNPFSQPRNRFISRNIGYYSAETDFGPIDLGTVRGPV